MLIGNMNCHSKITLANIHWSQKFFLKHFSWMSRFSMSWYANHDTPLMVICYFNLKGTSFTPFEADPVLIVDSNAVFAFSITRQTF